MVSPLSHGLGNEAIQVLTLFSGHTGRGRSGLAASVGACSKYPLISSGIVYEMCYLGREAPRVIPGLAICIHICIICVTICFTSDCSRAFWCSWILIFMEEGCKNLTLNAVFYILRIQQNQPLVNRKWLWWKMVYCNRLLTPRSVYTILWSTDWVIIASCMTQWCFLVVDYHGLWLCKVAFAWLRDGCKQNRSA